MPLSLVIAVALLGPAQADGLRQLSSRELRTIVRGSTITRVRHYEAPPYSNIPPPAWLPLEREAFWSGGRYAGEFDNYEPYGRYRIFGDQVCVTSERDREGCYSIFVDGHGQYWMTTPTSRGPFRVTISKIPDRR